MKNIILFFLILPTFFIYPQRNLEEALRKGGWTGGISGWVGWENYKTTTNIDDQSSNAKINGFNFIFSSRNGSIVEKNGVFGFDFQWREKTSTTKPDPNPDNTSVYKRDKEWFIGLWARYYIPMAGNFAMFLEGSGGYAVYNQVNETQSDLEYSTGKVEGYANGFAYNAGIGFSNFISPNAAFEITGRWEGGSLNGTMENSSVSSGDLNVKPRNIFILFGFQVFLR
jgi:hypothetical protein